MLEPFRKQLCRRLILAAMGEEDVVQVLSRWHRSKDYRIFGNFDSGPKLTTSRMTVSGDQLPELPCIWATANGSLSAVANFMCERLGSVGALLTGFATTPSLLSSERSSSVKRHAVGSEICIQV